MLFLEKPFPFAAFRATYGAGAARCVRTLFPGALTIPRELSLTLSVDLDIRRPPTL
jgi:hypothetical protein